MSKPEIGNFSELLDLLNKETKQGYIPLAERTAIMKDMNTFLHEAGRTLDAMGAPIKSEADSLIGSDGSGLDAYIAKEQTSVSRPLTDTYNDELTLAAMGEKKTIGDQFKDEFFPSSSVDDDLPAPGGTDTTVKPVGTKRSWYNFKRYTQGKYRNFDESFLAELDFGIDSDTFEDSTSEWSSEPELGSTAGGIRPFVPEETPGESGAGSGGGTDPELGDDPSDPDFFPGERPVIEPGDAPPEPDINTPVPADNPLDVVVDPMDAEPGYDPYLEPMSEQFSWSHPKTWKNWRRAFGKKGTGLSEPLLPGTEMVDMSGRADRGTSEMLLSERPSPMEASPEFTPEMRAGLNDLISKAKASGMSDAAMASEFGIGVSNGGGMWITRATLKDYITKQGRGLLAAPIMIPLVMLLNQAHEGLGDTLSLGLVTADLLMTGDPLGILVYGVGQMYDLAAKSRQKVIDNDTPDKDYGSKIGYVREGDTWYPAIYNQKYKSTGLAASDQQMTLDYGHDIGATSYP